MKEVSSIKEALGERDFGLLSQPALSTWPWSMACYGAIDAHVTEILHPRDSSRRLHSKF
jgi:hypothetical protein